MAIKTKLMKRFIVTFALTLLSSIGAAASFGQEPQFETAIAPLLKKYCAGCHNPQEANGDFSVHSFQALLQGGENGAVLKRGNRNASRLFQLLTGGEPAMPPEDSPQPTDAEIESIGQWIDRGATANNESQSPLPEFNPHQLEAAKNAPQSVTAADWSKHDLIAIGRFQRVELVDGQTKATRKLLTGLPGKVNSVRFSTDGERLVVAGGIVGVTGTASIWDVKTGKKLRQFRGHNDTIYSAMESPDGNTLVTAGYDRRILIWDLKRETIIRELTGHNGAIYDLDFSQDSRNLISASGDQTVKVWELESGQRLDTLGQPLKEQFAARLSPDNRHIAAAGGDHRIRVWQFVSRQTNGINPIVHSRFAHQATIVALRYSHSGDRIISTAEDQTIKVWNSEDLSLVSSLPEQPDIASAIAVSPDARQLFIGRLDGSTDFVRLPSVSSSESQLELATGVKRRADPPSSPPTPFDESEPNDNVETANAVKWPVAIKGAINGPGTDVDLYSFQAEKDQSVMFEVRAARDKSPLDSKIEILDQLGQPVPRVVLRAVRDSYFTFRGKNSTQSDDFRVHNWTEMKLNNFLYSGGEVVKLFHPPRGPDSGFQVYPGYGSRYTYFGTTSVSHALHEPAYVVEPHPVGSTFPPNGLPVFRINYVNDDDPRRKSGSDSKLRFVAPARGQYIVRVSDVRGFGGNEFKYTLTVRPPKPDFRVNLGFPKELRRGGIHEVRFTADRLDNYSGPIKIKIDRVPEFAQMPSELLIEANHNLAFGTIRVAPDIDEQALQELQDIEFSALAQIGDDEVERRISKVKSVKLTAAPKVNIRIVRPENLTDALFDSAREKPTVLEAFPGQKIEAKVVAQRINHNGRIQFGQADAGRNLPHGVYVDDIGLNGLMIPAGKIQQRFFINVKPWVKPTTCQFHILARNVEGQTSVPVTLVIKQPIAN